MYKVTLKNGQLILTLNNPNRRPGNCSESESDPTNIITELQSHITSDINLNLSGPGSGTSSLSTQSNTIMSQAQSSMNLMDQQFPSPDKATISERAIPTPPLQRAVQGASEHAAIFAEDAASAAAKVAEDAAMMIRLRGNSYLNQAFRDGFESLSSLGQKGPGGNTERCYDKRETEYQDYTESDQLSNQRRSSEISSSDKLNSKSKENSNKNQKKLNSGKRKQQKS